MRLHLLPLLLVAGLLVATATLTACSSDPGEGADVGDDTGLTTDVGNDVLSDATDVADDDADDDAGTPDIEAEYCESCQFDSDCVEEGALCFELADGEHSCGAPCDPEEGDCPEDSACMIIDEEENTQCVPTILTCTDRCEEVDCPAGEYCDPITGTCASQPGICETGCQFDTDCGDPQENVCLATGAPDGETMCTTTCDPTASGEEGNLECPSDFFCGTLDEESESGVCFPFSATCIDRCHDVDCPAGHNCDPRTGDCVEATTGACEDTCDHDAHCEGQDDVCLDIGIGEGGHCWLDCTDDQTCPDGYDCTAFLGLTTNLCIPPAQQCDECYEADCFPDGICNPTTGECMPHPENCIEEGCDEDQLCEPTSKRCVDIDRTCSGDSWAVDCDNVVTRCTSQTSGTEGICATICFDDEDCHGERTCTETEYGDLCLGPDLGGPRSCGVLTEPGADIGAPCDEDGDCADDLCVEAGSVPGFCSTECDTDADCPDAAQCGLGPDGDAVCLPAQCRCAADPGLAADLDDGLRQALEDVGLTICDLEIPAAAVEQTGDWSDRLLTNSHLASLLSFPPATTGVVRNDLNALDDVESPVDLLVQAPAFLGLAVEQPEPELAENPDLTQALVDFSDSAGDPLDSADIDAAIDDVPQPVRDLAAHLVDALDDAYRAREDALDAAGLDESTLEKLFDETHRLLLPYSTGQSLLDVSDPDIADGLDNFPLGELADIGARLAATVTAAIDDADLDAADFESDEFLVVINTPAGAVVVGDADDNLYDAAENEDLDQPLALILDIGGKNEYRIPVAANQTVANGVSILVDLEGDNTYSYPQSGDELDGEHLLVSDEAGRLEPSLDNHGAVSASETARQGVGRLGLGMLFDMGGANTYETLRIGQGAGILGVGALFDFGEQTATFDAEAFAQGAALGGVGLLYAAGGDNDYRLWHAGQGFGSGAGVGLLYDRSGSDQYTAVTGVEEEEQFLYLAPSDAEANYSLAQGAAAGAFEQLGAGIGILRDADGNDTYTAGAHAQGYGTELGMGLLADGDGDDAYTARNFSQGTGIFAGIGLLLDTGGDDEVAQSSFPPEVGQGAGDTLGWGALIFEGGENSIDYNILGGGLADSGGMGFALFDGGPNDHDTVGGGLGLALQEASSDSPQNLGYTAGIFVQTGGADDVYTHPSTDLGVGNDTTWRQDDEEEEQTIGIGLDQ